MIWTDYPILELGDEPGKEAPIRECLVERSPSPHSKYVEVIVGGVKTEIKRGYLYSRPGRCGEVPLYDFLDGWCENRKWYPVKDDDDALWERVASRFDNLDARMAAAGAKLRSMRGQPYDLPEEND